MEQHRDEHIVCADCGASFVFSAAEADVFAQRGLTAPKRCKECRRVRKQQRPAEGGRAAQGGDRGGWGQPSPAYDNRAPRGSRQGPPQYTGDVNEYRSPMTGGAGGYPWRPDAAPPRRPPPRPAPAPYRSDEYRSPMGNGAAPYRSDDYRSPMGNGAAPYRSDDYRSPMPDRGYPRPPGGGPAPQGGPAHGPRGGNGNGNGFAPRRAPSRDEGERRPAGPPRRQAAATFPITCDSCGTQAEVPFKPAEGREVYCQPCYRARKPQ
jgi:CxxC-x17-CxxC domain-containing protein